LKISAESIDCPHALGSLVLLSFALRATPHNVFPSKGCCREFGKDVICTLSKGLEFHDERLKAIGVIRKLFWQTGCQSKQAVVGGLLFGCFHDRHLCTIAPLTSHA
jgi:hypothetical protein